MPYITLNGQSISTSNANCPVEIVSSSTNCFSDNFFQPNGSVHITGVTDSDYKLISDYYNGSGAVSSMFPANKLNAFKRSIGNDSALKVNNVNKKYLAKGYAPIGSTILNRATLDSGDYVFIRNTNGSCYIYNSSETQLLATLSTAAQHRNVMTFYLHGGGGGGCGGGTGLGWWGGGGGGGGAAIIFTRVFGENEYVKWNLSVGSGGYGGGNNSAGGNGSPSYIDEYCGAGAGLGGTKKTGGSGGTYSLDEINNDSRVYNVIAYNGVSGGNEGQNGSSTSSQSLYNYTVIANKPVSSIGGFAGGAGGNGTSGQGSGGGASYITKGGTISDPGGLAGYGAGGWGGSGAFGVADNGNNGGRGIIEIWY